ncbi:MAG: 1-acyl-sn-glycerol-3-phosphate acyltransferase, partial [Gammaproteobacteria bacterium]
GLDFGCWRLAFNGTEPGSPRTFEVFASRVALYGFRREALAPVYGLAEATLGVAFSPLQRGPRYDRVRREPMALFERAEPAAEDEADALDFVSCGPPIPGFEVRTVDPSGRETAEREVGSVQFRGPGCTAGYFRNPEATRAVTTPADANDPGGAWLDSGDRGYMVDGELYLSGRVKDVIIRAGRNIYPYELEQCIAEVDGVRRGCVAAFGAGHAGTGTERLVIVAETRERDEPGLARMREQIQALTVDQLGMPADEIILAAPHTVLKTSSGKIRRSAIRELHERGRLTPSTRAPWLQLVRLTVAGAAPALRKGLQGARAWAYAAWCWLCFVPAGLVAMLGVLCLPSLGARWRFAGRAARALFALVGVRLNIVRGTGQAGAPGGPRDAAAVTGAHVICSNHSSYLDGLVLAAALERPVRLVAKSELAGFAPMRVFLERLGCLFVDRFDPERSAQDADRLGQALDNGEALGVFPEGTFHRMPGLLPFQMGAFAAAVRAGVPIVPVVLRGTRSILRGDVLFPRRGSIRVRILEPVAPAVNDDAWGAAVDLRERVRSVMLEQLGEPDLADRRPLLDLAGARPSSG